MTKPEKFDASDEAVMRGEWLNRQSREASASSKEVIRKSRQTLKKAQDIKSKFEDSEE